MIIEFTVENYRSIKTPQILSLIADSGRKKENNVIDLGELRLLKSVVIYGSNASGKTNVVKAFDEFRWLIMESSNLKRGEKIKYYDPYRLSKETVKQPTSLSLDFIYNNTKYTYEFSYNQDVFVKEKLIRYSKISSDQGIELFSRQNEEITLSKELSNLENDKNILANRLFLSDIGGNSNKNQLLGDLFTYFIDLTFIWEAGQTNAREALTKGLVELFLNDGISLKDSLQKLMRVADVKIESIIPKENPLESFQFPNNIPEDVKKEFVEKNRYQLFTGHRVYDQNKQATDLIEFPLEEESQGTQALFAIGGLILATLMEKSCIWIDEFENSLHPKLSKFLVKLFHHPKTNPKNAQLIFTTHETTLLDKELFRKDQIWFTEKNKYGETDLFSAQDFDGVREDVPFEKWYMEGKFGGQPNIKEMEFIFGDE